MDTLEQLHERLAAAPDGAARLRALNALAQALTRAGDADRALPLAHEAERLAIELGDDAARSRALCNSGVGHYLCARYTQGLEDSLNAVVLAERAGDLEAVAHGLLSAAACQYQMGAREEASLAMYQALEVAEARPSDPLLVRVHNSLGILLGDKGRYDESDEHYRLAMEIGARSNDAVYTARVKMNYASHLCDRGQDLERGGDKVAAHRQYLAGLRLCEQLAAGEGVDGAYNKAHWVGTLGELHRAIGDYERARECFEEMLAHGTQMSNPHQQADALMNLGKTHMGLGNAAEARRHFERALELASGANVRRLIAESFLSLSEWFEACGEFRNALEYHKRFHALREDMDKAEDRASGEAHQIWLKFQRLRREARGHQERADALARDNDDLTMRVDRLARAAHEDSLTGLSNRRYLDSRIPELLAAVKQRSAAMCVGIIDIDHFKSINDRHSHSLGDAVLRSVARIIGGHCREGDIAARFGGDEFVVCLRDTRLEDAVAVLDRLRAVVENHDWHALRPGLEVTLSVGVAEIETGDSQDSLMEKVDRALYRAKGAGRNCVAGARDAA
ncbi:MAG TPA: diguanylate cyclase [Usitatibacter sp.]|nr:diguanylate cyclase [Usitatibacter sp.]